MKPIMELTVYQRLAVDSQFLYFHHYYLIIFFQAMKILNQNCMQMHCLIILCFLFTFTAATAAAAADDPNHISINCGGAAPATALTGRQWLRDAAPEGSSTTATVKQEMITVIDPVPYKIARISHFQFSYAFQLSPGQKFIRLHFNPASYSGFQSFSDLFTVEAGPFTLLANFSASITARALTVNTLAKEFCIVVQENQPLNIVFSPENSQSKCNYAFINGIEIISVPSTLSYCHGGDIGVRVLGHKSVIYVDNTTALERIYHQNIKQDSVSFGNDISGMFGMWASILKGNANKPSNLSWGVSVDVGFRYLVRIHLSEVGLKMDFMLLIDNMIALTSADILQQGGNQSILWYNYMVMVKGDKRLGKRRISISLNSQHEFLDRQGPLEGFEVFKLSNHDQSLASPNPLPPRGDIPSLTTKTLLYSLLGRGNAVATVLFTMICLVNILVHLMQKMCEADFIEEETKPSARAKRLCRRFSLAEIQSATQNFHSAFIVGKGGFGNVYQGLIDNGREVVAIKRSKPDSKQGEIQFWTEVETLSEIRHVNLISIIGYCIEEREMMLVYEYMPCGSLADHLYKLARKNKVFDPLSWKQRLKICIGAGRAIDYLHTGHGILHRDVKASNILLDEKFVAKVSDFGLAKIGTGSESQTEASTNFKGTIGYIDPNYFKTHKLTKKSDMYSFGVVLLEVLCGRPAVEPWNEEDTRSLTKWATDNISKGDVDHIVAPSLRGEISPDSLKTFVKVAERCLHDEPTKRLTAARVVIKLELALQQQEKSESLTPIERTSVVDFLSSTGKSQKENMNFLVPNEKSNVADALLRPSAHDEIRNVTDAIQCTDKDKTILSVSPRPMASSGDVQAGTSLPQVQINSAMINSGKRKDGRISTMLRISRKLWPWDAFWKTRKPSTKSDLIGISKPAPVSHWTSNIALEGNTVSNKRKSGMILTTNLRIFSSEEVKTATRNFSEDTVLSGFGKVYKGWVHDNSSAETGCESIVAVKKFNHESTQEWQSEVNFLGRLSHPNLVKLLGYGWDDKALFLVYEYMSCGTLADHLNKLARKSSDIYPLSWRQRLKICIGVGRALDYLHMGHGIIHLNVKASNILLDEKFGAKVSDFSLAVTGSSSESQSQDSTHLIGTFGYTDRTYFRTRKLKIKSDTFSLGVVLLEVLCGRPAVDSWNEEDKRSLTTWAIENIGKGQVDHIVAPCLRGEISPDSLKTFVEIAKSCLHDEPRKRPVASHIVTKLEVALHQQEKAESLPLKERTSVEDDTSPSGQILPIPNLRVFTLLELQGATRNFRSDSVLGEGGFGKVYKGWLDEKASEEIGNRTLIAVKRLESQSMQGFEEWQSEVNFLGRLSHPNLVTLLGYCWEERELLLVYEYMPKGSLENHLFGRGPSVQPLPWDIRLKILIGAARGLAFLHAADKKVIYRDFKASNILLDESFHAKLSDFGLAKMGPTASVSHVSTRVMGTYGYAAPEYIATGHLYVKSDVYGFGVVLVEMLTALRALDTDRPSGQQNLTDWIKPHLSDRKKLKKMIDFRLEGQYPIKSAFQIAQLALTCLEAEPKKRPSMQETVQTLERIGSSSERPRVHFSHQMFIPQPRSTQEASQSVPFPSRT